MVWMLINDCDAELAKQTPLTVRAPFLEYCNFLSKIIAKVPEMISRRHFFTMQSESRRKYGVHSAGNCCIYASCKRY